jgi:hypothetical protein
MSRTIHYASLEATQARGPMAVGGGTPGSNLDVDGYLERLAKYVPGEILTGFAPLALLTKDRAELLATVSIAFLLLTPVYLYVTRVIQPGDGQPKFRRYMYVLSPLAFVVWALNISEAFRGFVAGLAPVKAIGTLDATAASVVLVLGALAIPAIDILLDYRMAKAGR